MNRIGLLQRRLFRLAAWALLMVLVGAGCGGDSDPTTTAPSSSDASTTTTTSVADATTTTEAPPGASPALVAFDGTTCSVSGGPVEPGLSEISVLNTSSAGSEAHVIKLGDSYALEDAAADVAADRFDQWGLEGNDDPSGYEFTNVRMPQSASEATVQPFTATTGTWAVVCLDFLNRDAFLGSDTFEVS